jgi:hypothetical protein
LAQARQLPEPQTGVVEPQLMQVPPPAPQAPLELPG